MAAQRLLLGANRMGGATAHCLTARGAGTNALKMTNRVRVALIIPQTGCKTSYFYSTATRPVVARARQPSPIQKVFNMILSIKNEPANVLDDKTLIPVFKGAKDTIFGGKLMYFLTCGQLVIWYVCICGVQRSRET